MKEKPDAAVGTEEEDSTPTKKYKGARQPVRSSYRFENYQSLIKVCNLRYPIRALVQVRIHSRTQLRNEVNTLNE